MDFNKPIRFGARIAYALLVVAGVVSLAIAEVVPRVMTFQGRILDAATQKPFTGTRAMVFRIYSAASGGTALWTENQSVEIQNGLYMVTLGSVTPLNLPFDAQYWLSVAVEGGAESASRFKLRTAPYAITADTVANFSGSDIQAEGSFAVDTPLFVIDRDQNRVGIGTASLSDSLTVLGRVAIRDTLTVRDTFSTNTRFLQAGYPVAPTGQILMWAGGTTPPAGYLVCDGSSLAVASYPDLFKVIGYAYGGSGASFNLPDLRGRIPVGKSTSSWCDVINEEGGARTVTLAAAEVASHSHTANPPSATTNSRSHTHNVSLSFATKFGPGSSSFFTNTDGAWMTTSESGSHTHTANVPSFDVGYTGTGASHNNLQPYVTVLYIIKVQ